MQEYNDTLHKLRASKLNLEYSTEYLLYYCLINKFKKNNQYYNFIYNTYLKEERCRSVTAYRVDFSKNLRENQ